MPHVITQSCCNDASCVHACPVNCIHPTPDEPDFKTAEMLYIDPATCVDCGACVTACPVGAIVPQSKLTDAQQPFLSINADFYQEPRPPAPLLAAHPEPLIIGDRDEAPRVAIVGSGPAAMYAADELLTWPGARVDVYERLSQPYGLARTGVAPDHLETRRIIEQFDVISRQKGFRFFPGVEVGRDVSHEDLLADHHAVIYAVGASADRRLTVPGAERAATATEFVAWYNGHPDHLGHEFDLSQRRAVIVGNGNVALDVARILTTDPKALASTSIHPAALEALRASKVEEVVIVGRRGPAQSSFTLSELLGLTSVEGVEVAVPASELDAGPLPLQPVQTAKLNVLRGLAEKTESQSEAPRRILLRYLLSPTEVTEHGLRFARNRLVAESDGVVAVPTGESEHIEAGLVLSSIGYRGRPIPGLPFDDETGTIPNEQGRILDPTTGSPLPGAYVTGWIKRGPTGFIGTNKSCARETVHALVDDFNTFRLRPQPTR